MLPLLLLLPVIGAIVAAVLPRARDAKFWALLVALLMGVIGVYLLVAFPYAQRGWQFIFPAKDSDWLSLSSIGFSFSLGMDTISLWLVILTILLMPLSIAASFDSIKDRPKQYYAWMLALSTAMLGVFVARDLLLFYIFFELTLIPMFFIIGIWGGPERRYAAAKFFLFTFAGSVFTLAAVVYLGMKAGTFDIDAVTHFAQTSMSDTERFWVALGFLAGFSVKVPLFPVHTWLPLAHTEAPTAGSVILAGVLLKLGTYGILRLVIPIGLVARNGFLFPNLIACIGVLCLIGIIYGALVAWVQQDIKKLVAYSSVSHLGFCVLGLMALNDYGIQGSVLYMVNHGLSTGALFLCIGMIYERYHTRDINELSGLARIMPKLAFFFVLFALSSIGLPGLNGFTSEFLTILGAFTSNYLGIGFGSIAALGVILGAVYMLHMVARVIWGPLKVPGGHGGDHGHGHEKHASTDINSREVAILVPLALAVVFLGVLPTSLMRRMLDPIQRLQQPITLTTPTPEAKVPTPTVVAAAK
ncbi:MAG TPA: NADH-quinone oxidoreductase subunit M [Tepidisphaeraceae bacterium]|nr:NADH-quinone oxidoreductase subunit M [Tepidisphaeraceae bacterium]